MGFSYNVSVLNQKGSPAIYTDTFANRPPFGYAGRLFIANDTSAIYEDTGTSWVLIANVSSGAGTLQQVTTNGNTSNVGISITAGGLSTNSLTDTALTLGSVLFSGAGGLVSQDNPAFFWDDTNNRLGINTTTPTNTLDLHFSGTNAMLGLNNTAGNQSAIVFANTGTNKWRVGNTATNTFDFYNVALASIAAYLDNTNNAATFNGSVQVLSSGGQRDTTSNFNSSIVDSRAAVNVTPVARFSNLGSGYVTKLILSDTINADCAITFQPNATIADSTFGIGINSFNNIVLKGDGKVGIGTITPTSLLNINTLDDTAYDGTADDGQAANGSTITLRNGSTAVNSFAQINMQVSGDSGRAEARIVGIRMASATSDMAFVTENANVKAEKMRITSSGNVLINSTTDNTVDKLQVSGNVSIDNKVKINTTRSLATLNIDVALNANNAIDIKTTQSPGGGAFIQFRNLSDVSCGSITHTTATTVTYNTLSDYRLKQDLKDFNGINLINSIKVYDFEWIEDKKRMYGVIAHEIQEIIPYAVTGKKDGEKMQGLDYSFLTPILTKAIQDQQKIIESLIKRIELLENK